MVVVVDFDYTLFNTHLFYNAFKEVFFKNGVSEEDWKRTYDETLKWDGGDYGFDYSFEKQVDRLIEEGYLLNRNEVVEDLYATLSDHFLYEDAIPFLEDMKQHFPERMLITAGNADYQRTKVEGVGVDEYFTDLVYTNGDKDKYVSKVYKDYDKVVFINDDIHENIALKQAMPHAHVITKFNQRRNTIEEMRDSGIPYFETLTAIKEYVTNELI